MQKIMLAKACAILAIGAGCAFAANATTNWTYDDTAKTVTDGKWVIAVTKYDSGAGTMTLGAITTESGDGVLDLRDMVVGGVAITGLTMPGSQAWQSAAVTNFYANNVAGTRMPAMFSENTQLREVELASETIQEITTSPRPFGGCSKLGKVVFKCPNLLYWNQNYYGQPIDGVVSNAFHDIVNPGVTNVGGSMFAGIKKTTGDIILTNLQFIGSAFYAGSATGSFQVTNIWIRTPQVAGFELRPSFAATKVKIEAPNMLTFCMMNGFNQLETDITNIVPRQIQTLGRNSITLPQVTGTLVLTNLTRIRSDLGVSYAGYAISLPKVYEMELRGPIDVITFPVFEKYTAMNRLVLDFPKMTNMYVGAFRMKNNGSLYIYGKPFPHEMMTNLLARVDGNGATGLTMYCSKKQKRDSDKKTWKDYAQDYGDDFPKASAPEGCFGVWREPNGTGTRGAWMVHLPQADDPQAGMCIVIR